MYNLRKRVNNSNTYGAYKKQRLREEEMICTEEEQQLPPPLEKNNYENIMESSSEDENNTDSSSEDENNTDSSSECDNDEDSLNDVVIDPEHKKMLISIKEEILKTEPNIKQLLETPLLLDDRAKLCQYYEIYKSQIPNTFDWLQARNTYNEMFKEFKSGYEQYSKYTTDEIERMKLEEETYKKFDAQLALKYKILGLNTSTSNKEVIYRRFQEMSLSEKIDEEYAKIKNWLNWAVELPYDNIKSLEISNPTKFISDAKKRLDEELYGMKNVKEQILLFLNAKINNPSMIHTNLALIGKPGVGKTHIARLLSEIMNCGFSQISFGGSVSADFLKGYDYTYIGSQPGEIVKCLRKMKHKNGIIFLDEMDKISNNPDIKSALLHIIDPSQNYDFHDLFLSEIQIDLSQIWWVASMNSLPSDDALADRWWIIDVKGYSNSDKVDILEKYLLPKALKNSGYNKDFITFSDDASKFLIEKVCPKHDKGVRTIEKSIKDIVNKVSFIITHQDEHGNLPFKLSFDIGCKLTQPVYLTKNIIDKLIDNKDLDIMLSMMYI